MQATYIQKLIRINATAIARKEAMIALYRQDARRFAKAGEKAYAIADNKVADKLTRALTKLVDIQRVLKTELATIHRFARIERKIAEIKKAVPNFQCLGDDLTSREFEAALDQIIDIVVPKKADTRPLTQSL